MWLREASPVKRRHKPLLCAAIVTIGSGFLITLHNFVTISNLDTGAHPHSFTANKVLSEEPALKSKSMWHMKGRSELTNVDPNSAHKQNFKEFVAEFFLELAKKFHQTRVDCSSLFAGDRKSIKRAMGISKVLAGLERIKHGKSDRVAKLKSRRSIPPPPKLIREEVLKWPPWEFQRLTNLWYLKATLDCETFKQTRGYVPFPLSLEEEEFPIAFSLIVYKDIEMVERLLRSVYRPQNSYCIHVDLKADPQFYAAMEAVADCFRENVRMSSKRVSVKWGTYTTLEPELICMGDLLDMGSGESAGQDVKKRRKKSKWQYFINLTGQDFPLKTNSELVKILKAFRGANNEEGTLKNAERKRWKSEPPHGIKAVKGAVHTVINRATVDFIVNSPIATDFLEWLRDTDIPDETLFSSINYNPQLGIPGTYNGSDMESVKTFARFKKWNRNPFYKDCPSRLVINDICILSTGDLKDLGQSPHLFANKFFLDQDRIVIGCLEEKLFNNTRDESLGSRTFNTALYSQQDFVLNQVRAAL